MGAKEASVAAMGMMAMAVVFRGRRQMTAPGWTKAGLLISKRGRVGSRSPLQGPRGASAKFATPMEAMKAMEVKMMAGGLLMSLFCMSPAEVGSTRRPEGPLRSSLDLHGMLATHVYLKPDFNAMSLGSKREESIAGHPGQVPPGAEG